jgi:hypothetical protein
MSPFICPYIDRECDENCFAYQGKEVKGKFLFKDHLSMPTVTYVAKEGHTRICARLEKELGENVS